MPPFKLYSKYKPTGDQPKAIEELVKGIEEGRRFQVLLGVTGSGKTFTIANVIERVQKPTLIISHNKTLAAQLYGELREFFPENAVEYFISYYDYYQPEAYIPETDTYIAKDADINENIERLRLRATTALLERKDVIIVASVSAIYALGEPDEIKKFFLKIEVGEEISRDYLLDKLIEMQYRRNDTSLEPGTFMVRGDTVQIIPPYRDRGLRIEFFGDEVDRIIEFDPLTRKKKEKKDLVYIYPATHWLTSREKIERAVESIKKELAERLKELKREGKFLEAQRLKQRTEFDIAMLKETGHVQGIENYSRHLSGRPPGSRPYCLIDYFPRDFLMVIDESHVTIPQIRGMYRGDYSRKKVLVEYGFRLPSCLDNRPLKFEEFEALINQAIFMSATPGEYEIKKSEGRVVEQIIRPTGLVDPKIVVRPTENQMEDMIEEIRKRVDKGERVLITTITKDMAENLANYLLKFNFRVSYLHSEIDSLKRVMILRDLRTGKIDIIVGVNLLREGLDLPEVSLVIITDADKTGFLRSEVALIQTAGRAARNRAGMVLMYADEITDAMKRAIKETERRRKIQIEYNKKHGIVPRTIKKTEEEILKQTQVADEAFSKKEELRKKIMAEYYALKKNLSPMELIDEIQRRMKLHAENLEFEEAAVYRDILLKLKKKGL